MLLLGFQAGSWTKWIFHSLVYMNKSVSFCAPHSCFLSVVSGDDCPLFKATSTTISNTANERDDEDQQAVCHIAHGHNIFTLMIDLYNMSSRSVYSLIRTGWDAQSNDHPCSPPLPFHLENGHSNSLMLPTSVNFTVSPNLFFSSCAFWQYKDTHSENEFRILKDVPICWYF